MLCQLHARAQGKTEFYGTIHSLKITTENSKLA